MSKLTEVGDGKEKEMERVFREMLRRRVSAGGIIFKRCFCVAAKGE